MEPSEIIHIGEYFQEYTKYQYFFSPSEMSQGIAVPEAEKPIPPATHVTILPDPAKSFPDRTENLFDIMKARRSRRDYSDQPITLKQLAILLWSIQGVIESGNGYSLRTSPSAGARHPLETYINLNRVEDQMPGLYRYSPFEHKLVQLSDDQKTSHQLAKACLGQNIFMTCAVSFIWTAVIQRSRWKYQQRAYRYIYLDAGHVCQNLYLACEALGLGCCAVAAFDDDAVNKILDIDGKEEFVIYLATVGSV
ncbi:SagB/ThcOx family dehydrogenase [candidate division KSB1 bacterium]|nr:SagB/ThcOx family dehydrogenase [candidate division KSB1 bacterium]